jgi:hypothetical protein
VRTEPSRHPPDERQVTVEASYPEPVPGEDSVLRGHGSSASRDRAAAGRCRWSTTRRARRGNPDHAATPARSPEASGALTNLSTGSVVQYPAGDDTDIRGRTRMRHAGYWVLSRCLSCSRGPQRCWPWLWTGAESGRVRGGDAGSCVCRAVQVRLGGQLDSAQVQTRRWCGVPALLPSVRIPCPPGRDRSRLRAGWDHVAEG